MSRKVCIHAQVKVMSDPTITQEEFAWAREQVKRIANCDPILSSNDVQELTIITNYNRKFYRQKPVREDGLHPLRTFIEVQADKDRIIIIGVWHRANFEYNHTSKIIRDLEAL